MLFNKAKSNRAFTTLEVMIAVVILIIAILGTSAFRYSAALNARRVDLYTNSARTALLLCEAWSGKGGAATFDPVAVFGADMSISADVGPDVPAQFVALGSYKIVLQNDNYYVTLSSKNIAADLRALNVIVSWDQTGAGSGEFEDADKSYRLTTYVENPN
jgi:type II secretory pathway pseudopilin PulG